MTSGVYSRTKEHGEKISKSRLGIPAWNKGKQMSAEQRAKRTGPNNHRWKGGKGNRKYDPEYQEAVVNKPTHCALCNEEERNLSRKLAYDHNHKTGKFRGWLCGNCNRALGLLRDDPELLKKAVRYLQIC